MSSWRPASAWNGGWRSSSSHTAATLTRALEILEQLPDIGSAVQMPIQPRWPVIWAVPEACAATVPPFGRKLELD